VLDYDCFLYVEVYLPSLENQAVFYLLKLAGLVEFRVVASLKSLFFGFF